MRFEKGNPGKPKGAITKNSRLVKDVFADAFAELQKGPANLQSWGAENPTEFYKLASKLIPIQLAGDPENPLAFTLKDAVKFAEPDDNSQPEI